MTIPTAPLAPASGQPYDFIAGEKLEDGIGLCMSGGGYRATLFHLGALIRLNELGLLRQISRFSSVSGGSITLGVLANGWTSLRFDGPNGEATNFESIVTAPLLDMTGRTIDWPSVLKGFLPWTSAGQCVAAAYDKVLFKGRLLNELPETPHFVFNTTNVESGKNFRFRPEYAADYELGQIKKPAIPLAEIVAASSAFPPILSPMRVKFAPGSVERLDGASMHVRPFTDRAVLTDGGVYDNLGIEPIWGRYKTILVSNAGRNMPVADSYLLGWLGSLWRVTGIIHNQVDNLRERVLLGYLYPTKLRDGAFWRIDGDLNEYANGLSIGMDFKEASRIVREAAFTSTRLKRLRRNQQSVVVHAGYLLTDLSIRRHYRPSSGPPSSLPNLAAV